MPLTQRSGRRPVLAAASLLLVLTIAACGSDDDSSEAGTGDGTTTPAPTDDAYGGGTDGGEQSTEAGTIVAEDFSLTDLTVGPGEDIVLQNDGAATHTATADDDSFDLGEVPGGDTSDPVAAPTTPGDYAFHCEIHPSMTATLTVES
jgi:plastocyanin